MPSTTLSPEPMVSLGQGGTLGKKPSKEIRTRKAWEHGTDFLVRIHGPAGLGLYSVYLHTWS